MDLSPATKQQLAIEAKKLAGENNHDYLTRWHRSINQMSGALVLLMGRHQTQLSPAHIDEWIARSKTMLKEMETLKKRLSVPRGSVALSAAKKTKKRPSTVHPAPRRKRRLK